MLRERGISVHARSVFLQGLILRGSDVWPKFLSDEFLTSPHLYAIVGLFATESS